MRLYYLAHYPRDFANEYAIYAGTIPELDKLKAILDQGAERNTCKDIARAEAIRLGWRRPKEAKRDGEQWFGGFADDAGKNPETLKEAIAAAREATLAVLAFEDSGRADG